MITLIRKGILLATLLTSAASCDRAEHANLSAAGPRTGAAVASRPGVAEIELAPDFHPSAGQTIYVPVYSRVHTSHDARPFDLAVTLSVRNTDRHRPIVLTVVRYHDHDGRLVRNSLKKPLRIGPLASMEFFVDENDASGGSSASFLLEWVAEQAVSAPVVEAVMIGTASTQGISFLCPGRVVAERPTGQGPSPSP